MMPPLSRLSPVGRTSSLKALCAIPFLGGGEGGRKEDRDSPVLRCCYSILAGWWLTLLETEIRSFYSKGNIEWLPKMVSTKISCLDDARHFPCKSERLYLLKFRSRLVLWPLVGSIPPYIWMIYFIVCFNKIYLTNFILFCTTFKICRRLYEMLCTFDLWSVMYAFVLGFCLTLWRPSSHIRPLKVHLTPQFFFSLKQI